MSQPNTRRLNVTPAPSPAQFTRRDRNLSPPTPNFQNPNPICFSQSRRSIRQNYRDRKTVKELERECDEDDGDDVPDDCFLENVPLSPRPSSQQSLNNSKSTSTSPERPIIRKTKSFGNGTSAQPAEQGELRSPRSSTTRKDSTRKLTTGDDPSKTRAMSWSAAMFDLSQETKKLTQALEEYERTLCESGSIPYIPPEKPRVKSAFAKLPPMSRTEMMIEPLPISKEKEAVLSRTRPSWLPPKDPAEERRHLKEYERMIANFLEAGRKNIAINEKGHQSFDKINCRVLHKT
ncbi:putative tbc domain protein [Erysiphe neolycopersici]|uniref:Putative tbc domain protein n=1 Tax=Erysiphe neolycopersici TaxID=212602 RepID=A0A420HX48_9PEZI|nr:putative tbc domain protein [Erysiphe neolycopersici]